jgi:hypothetical protein
MSNKVFITKVRYFFLNTNFIHESRNVKYKCVISRLDRSSNAKIFNTICFLHVSKCAKTRYVICTADGFRGAEECYNKC